MSTFFAFTQGQCVPILSAVKHITSIPPMWVVDAAWVDGISASFVEELDTNLQEAKILYLTVLFKVESKSIISSLHQLACMR